MHIAVTTAGPNLKDAFEPRFGRAPHFIIFDTMAGEIAQVLDNAANLQAERGAGIQAAEFVVQAEVDAVITGFCGPKAFRVLEAAGIRVYNTNVATASDALKQFAEGKLAAAAAPNAQAHWL